MPRKVDPRRRCLPLAEWPAADREAWEAAMRAARGRFSGRGRAGRLSAEALEKTREGYGRWLGFLDHRGWLDRDAAPGDRPSEARVASYFDGLRALGNRDHTITGRFQELRDALAIMAPDADFGWLARPGGVPLRRRLAMEKRPIAVHHSADLLAWGLEMMRCATTLAGSRRRQVMLRDGLLIALLAIAGPRRRALLAMRVGRQLRRDGDGWRVAREERDDKTGRPLDYLVPDYLVPWVERHLAVERRELLGGQVQDAVWINWGGEPLGEAGVEKRIRWCSAKRFGPENAFGTHRFRHCIGTTAPLVAPRIPTLGAAVLGVSGAVHAKHYDRGKRAAAARGFLEALERDREEARALLRPGRHGGRNKNLV